MSVDISRNPWTFAVDGQPGPNGQPTDPAGFLYKQYVDIKDMVITKVLTAGNRILILDRAGGQIVDFIAEEGTTSFRVGRLGLVNGLNISVMDEGEVTIAV